MLGGRIFKEIPKSRWPISRVGYRPIYRTALPCFRSINSRRTFSLSSTQRGAIKGWGTVINIIAGAYIGGLIVCGTSLYFLYHDADSRQNIPFELSFEDQINTVKALNKDDVLQSPRYSVKHYRRLLINLAKESDPDLYFDENDLNDNNKYDVPLIDANTLIKKKSNKFANFYIDIVLRYSKALLAKGELNSSIYMLKQIIDNDDLFFKLGDAERLSQCCRLLSKVCPQSNDKVLYLTRSINMLESTFSSIKLDDNYLLQDNSRITDELITCLNGLAFVLAKSSKQPNIRKREKQDYLTKSLNIYLSNLKMLKTMNESIMNGEKTQASYPLFNCDAENMIMIIAEIKAHISELMWAKGFKKNAISWGEEVIKDIYYDHSNSTKASPILINVFHNLIVMYDSVNDKRSKQRCEDLKEELVVFEAEPKSWYDGVINRFCKIIYNKGPLGVIEKALTERFGQPQRLQEIEEFEEEDVE